MDTDSYSFLLSEDKINKATSRALAESRADPSHPVCYHAANALHDSLCPCLLQDCDSCAQHSRIEDALIEEITARVRLYEGANLPSG